jgi:hypothetical protein
MFVDTAQRLAAVGAVALLASCHSTEPVSAPATALGPAIADDEVSAVPDIPLVAIDRSPVRIWYEDPGDGAVGGIRVVGHAETTVGDHVDELLRSAIQSSGVKGFVGYGVAELGPMDGGHTGQYVAAARKLVDDLTELASEHPRFVEMRPIPQLEVDEVAGFGQAAPVLHFRSPDAGPTFLRAGMAPPPRGISLGAGSVLSNPRDDSWQRLARLFCGADAVASRNVFFRRQGASVEALYVVAGPYLTYAPDAPEAKATVLVAAPTDQPFAAVGGAQQ